MAPKAGIQPHFVVRVQRGDWGFIYDHEKPRIDGFEQMTLRAPNERLQREVIGANERCVYDYSITACMRLGKQDEAIEIAERLLNRTIGTILGAKFEESKAASLGAAQGRPVGGAVARGRAHSPVGLGGRRPMPPPNPSSGT